MYVDMGYSYTSQLPYVLCSRLSSNAAIDSSDWRCSRATEESVPRCRDDKQDGADPMTPDVRIPGMVKRVKGLRQDEEEEDAEKLEETADGGAEQTESRAGNLDVSQGGSGPRGGTKTRGDAQKPPRPRRGVAKQGTVLL
ncbi:hypothetical protein NDU88_003228 [Pleurodeles waltl]|uniref:Uncharacterized protein n=1 Tax=Pleurodeles waltl TaxID=8319 RepID=A0AAV7VF67_PLEWA|nr:hypothetical protein NDU88_003228 [Pleurodeles waltl]